MNLYHFMPAEFTCKCGCGGNDMNSGFLLKLDRLRGLYGAPMVITSGYRCLKHEQDVGGTGANHPKGVAVDVLVAKGRPLKNFIEACLNPAIAMRRVVLYHNKPHVHIDENETLSEGVFVK